MQLTIFDTATGQIQRSISVPEGGVLLRQLGQGQDALFGNYDDTEYYVSADRATKRPRVSGLPTKGVAPLVYNPAALPAGAVLKLTNEAGEVTEIANFTSTVTFTDPGTYQIEVIAPFPWHGASKLLLVRAPVPPASTEL